MHIYVPDDLYERIKKEEDFPASQIAQAAFRRILQLRERYSEESEELEIELWTDEDQPYTATFEGTWLVYPDPDESRTREDGFDAGSYWGVARIGPNEYDVLVYVAHVNERWAPSYFRLRRPPLVGEEIPRDIWTKAQLADGVTDLRVPLDLD